MKTILIYAFLASSFINLYTMPQKIYIYYEQDEYFYHLKAAYWRNKLKQEWFHLYQIHIPTSEELDKIVDKLPEEWPDSLKEEHCLKLLTCSIKAHVKRLKRSYERMVAVRYCKLEDK